MRKIILIFIVSTISFNLFAQSKKKLRQEEKKSHIEEIIRQREEGVNYYKKSFVFGAKLTTDGYGVFFELGRAKDVKKALLYQLEISERKHFKEEKFGNGYSNTVPFIYGKQNFVYPVKLGAQKQILLGNKSNKNGVSITGNFGGGVALALLRPYYVQAKTADGINFIKYDSPDSLDFLGAQIVGGPTFSKGWSEMSVTPGIYVKTALRFDYGAFNELVSAIEVGITGEYYSKKIPQVVYNKQKQFFFGAYFSLLFGKRK